MVNIMSKELELSDKQTIKILIARKDLQERIIWAGQPNVAPNWRKDWSDAFRKFYEEIKEIIKQCHQLKKSARRSLINT